MKINQIIKWIDELRKSNDMWRYPVDECFGMLEDAITSDSRSSNEDSLNKGPKKEFPILEEIKNVTTVNIGKK